MNSDGRSEEESPRNEAPARQIARFGAFEFRLGSRELFKFGIRIRLQEQPGLILQLLLERPGAIVSRERLQRELWPETTFVEYDAGLNTAVSKLRSALSDSQATPIFIERVPKQGYRFVAPVVFPDMQITAAPNSSLPISPVPDVRSAPLPTEHTTPSAAVSPVERKGMTWRVAIPVVLLVLFGIGAWTVIKLLAFKTPGRPELRPVVRYTVTLPAGQRLGDDTGRVVALSADGKAFAYIATAGNSAHVYAKHLGEERFQMLNGTDGAEDIFFSPDGSFLVFWAKTHLFQVDMATRAVTTLATWHPRADRPSGIWAGDGSIYFSNENEANGGFGSRILRVLPGRQMSPLPSNGASNERWLFVNQLLPGSQMLLAARNEGPTNRSIVAYSIRDGTEKLILQSAQGGFYLPASGSLVYSWKGDLLAAPFGLKTMSVTGPGVTMVPGVAPRRWAGVQAAISETGTLAWVPNPVLNRQFVWVNRSGRETPFNLPPAEYDLLALSPKGTRLLLSRRDGNRLQAIWIYDMVQRTWNRLLSGDWENNAGVWSPDESKVIVSATLNGESFENLYLASVAAPSPERLTPSVNPQFAQTWTAGAGVIFTTGEGSGSNKDLALLSLQPGEGPSALVKTAGDDTGGTLSPDGRWLAYSTIDNSGKSHVYMQAFAGPDTPQQVSAAGGHSPLWSPAGGEIFFRAGDSMWSSVVHNGKALAPRQLFSGEYTPASPWNRRYSVSPDGEKFLMMRDIRDPDDFRQIHVVVGWSTEVARSVSGAR